MLGLVPPTLPTPASLTFAQGPALGVGIALAVLAAVLLDLPPARTRRRGEGGQPWTCAACGQANEEGLPACWSCRLPRELQGVPPSHVSPEARWQCPRCSVWNGILRRGCWHCGFQR